MNTVHPYLVLLVGYIAGMIIQDEGISHGRPTTGILALGCLASFCGIHLLVAALRRRPS